MRIQAKNPGDSTDAAAAVPMTDGAVLQCLVAGPFNPKDPAKALDEAFLADEGSVTPDEDAKVACTSSSPASARQDDGLAWKFLKQDRPFYAHTDFEPLAIYRALGKPKPGQVAYAHAYIHSARAGKVALMVDHTAGCKVWVNGKEVYRRPDFSIGFFWWGPMSRARLWYQPPNRSQCVEVELKQGWNRLLFKVSGMEMEWGRGWAVLARFSDIPSVEHADTNILWATPLPDRSNANPIFVGNRIFVVSEHDELLCLDKSTGKILWHAFNNYYEATPKAERDAYPAFKEIAPLEEQALKESNPETRRDLLRQVKEALQKADPAKFGMNMESHPEGHWASTGFTTPTPCSDGRFVYVWFTSGVAACYDLDGKRQWIKRVDLLVRDPKAPYGPFFYPQGCVLAGGKFILWDRDTFALDAKTGDIAWRNGEVGLGFGPMPVVVGAQEAVIGCFGALRAADGKVLWRAPKIVMPFGYGGGAYADERLFIPTAGGVGVEVFNFTGTQGDDLKPAASAWGLSAPEENKHEGGDHFKKGEWKDIFVLSAPLCHEGLVYVVNCDGVLYVADEATGKLVYRQKLPLTPLCSVRAVGLCAPVTLGGKRVYVFDNQGNAVVFEAGREYKQVALNHIETFVERTHTGDGWQELSTYSAPVFEGKRIYVRGEANLYCIGEK